MSNSQEKYNRIRAINELLKEKIDSRDGLMAAKRKLSNKFGIAILSNSEILSQYKRLAAAGAIRQSGTIRESLLRKILRKRTVRTMSGIAPVAVLTRAYPCPARCAYCPTEKNMPKSYLSNEPAVMRAIGCDFDPYKQAQLRLQALEANGHEPTKIELIVIGGTWSALPVAYKYWFIEECFRAANDYGNKFSIFNFQFSIKFQIPNSKQIQNTKYKIQKLRQQLLREQKKNEFAKYRIIGLTLETRPDYINEKELWQMRELGCTRVELGVQAIDDKILNLNRRGHGVKEVVKATKLLKDYGFKVTYHIMPGLYGATAKKDLAMFKKLFTPLDKMRILSLDPFDENKDKKISKFISDKSYLTGFADERFQPDQIKFYPTVVTRGSLLFEWWRTGKYKPYSDKVLQNLIAECKKIVPPYVRILRLIRDIPKESIVAGNKITNLRQIMKDRGVKCRCIRCREAREQLKITNYELRIIKYGASGGMEYFLSYESEDGEILYGFCRLRLGARNGYRVTDNATSLNHRLSGGANKSNTFKKMLDESPLPPMFAGAGIIRELHVYGELVPVETRRSASIQHAGLGKRLMAEAENIAAEIGFKQMAVISGVGARGYYQKLGYKLQNSYMVKSLV